VIGLLVTGIGCLVVAWVLNRRRGGAIGLDVPARGTSGEEGQHDAERQSDDGVRNIGHLVTYSFHVRAAVQVSVDSGVGESVVAQQGQPSIRRLIHQPPRDNTQTGPTTLATEIAC